MFSNAALGQPADQMFVLLFKSFKEKWNFINQEEYQCLSDEDLNDDFLKHLKDEAVIFATKCLQTSGKQPRDDYKEFLELTLLFLGEIPPRGKRFNTPGAFHHARWLSKVIYSIKIYMFRKQFKVMPKEEKALLSFNLFASLLYMSSWFSCRFPEDAAINDLSLLKKFDTYKSVDEKISQTATAALKRHLWYLSKELIGLSFFSNHVSSETKQKMISKLNTKPNAKIVKRLENVADIHLKSIEDFVTSRSLVIFERLGIDFPSLLATDPSIWDSLEAYKKGTIRIKGLRVVNDCAERGIALISTYNEKLTKNEEQRQYLLNIVQQHRDKFKSAKKSLLMQMNKD